MKLELPLDELTALVTRQLNSLFIFNPISEGAILHAAICQAIHDCDYCFSKTPQ